MIRLFRKPLGEKKSMTKVKFEVLTQNIMNITNRRKVYTFNTIVNDNLAGRKICRREL